MKFVTCKEPPRQKKDKKIAIIGAGPGGLAAAGALICKGYQVDVYDAMPEPGGMLIFGIPDIRMPKAKIIEGIKELEKFGVKFILNTKVDKDIPFDEIIKKYDAVIIATGAWEEYELDIPGKDAEGVFYAVDFLVKIAKINKGYLPKDEMPKIGKKVVVIGGGDTAIDAAIVSKHMGAEVTIAYRRTREYMPAHSYEVKAAEKAGVKLMFLVSPKRIIVDENNHVKAIELEKMKLGAPDASGRPRPEPTGEIVTIDCDSVIFAVGEIPTPPFADSKKYGIEVDRKNRIIVDPNTYMTTRKGVFAVGDVVTGPKDIASAIKAGKLAANAVDKYLQS